MLPSTPVPIAVLMQLADGAPTAPTPPLPRPLREPRGRLIKLPSKNTPLTLTELRNARPAAAVLH